MRKVTTKMRPNDVLEVTEAEFLDLSRQGLIKEDRTAKKDLPKEEEVKNNAR